MLRKAGIRGMPHETNGKPMASAPLKHALGDAAACPTYLFHDEVTQ
jgi:hypothetical protein